MPLARKEKIVSATADLPFHVVIPARLDSSRLPGKVLRDLGGRPMIWHGYQNALQSGAQEVIVATDSEKIADCVRDFGGRFVLTGRECKCGTERVAATADLRHWQDEVCVVNLQGDEPFLSPEHIATVAGGVLRADTAAATLATRIDGESEVGDNVVKVVCDRYQNALYFSRSAIPYNWERGFSGLRHLGIYAYTCALLKRYASWPVSFLEKREKLEQLRILENGESLRVLIVKNTPIHGVDTLADLEAARDFLKTSH